MSARSGAELMRRSQRGTRPPAGTPGATLLATLLLAALLALTLALAPRAEGLVYWSNLDGETIGRANLDGSGVDRSFVTGLNWTFGVAVDAVRSLSFGKVKRNKQQGTARLVVKVPGPGEVDLAENDGVKPKRKQAEAADKEKLPIKPSARPRSGRSGRAR